MPVYFNSKLYLSITKKEARTEHEIRTENCSDTCQHFVLTLTKNDLTHAKTYSVTLNFDRLSKIKVEIVQVNNKVFRKCQKSNCHVILWLAV